MPTTRKRPPLAVLPYCHNCKPTGAQQNELTMVHADRPRPEICHGCGRDTISGVYVIEAEVDHAE